MKKIKFPLEMADHTKVTNLDDLRAHFDLESVVEYYKSGKLQTWLEDRYFEEEAEAVSALDETASDFQAQLCKIFGVEYSGHSVNLEEIAHRQARLEKLRSLTDEAEYLEQIDRVAFDQDELADLLDEKEKTIYLCGEKFMIPVSQKGVSYIGINAPSAHLSGKVPQSANELGICFTNVNVDNLPDKAETFSSKESSSKYTQETIQSDAGMRLDEVSDKAYYAATDKEGLSVCIESENYIMYLDREIGWDFQNINKHLYDKRTGEDTVKQIFSVKDTHNTSLYFFESHVERHTKDMSREDRQRLICEDNPLGLIYFFRRCDLIAVWNDAAYFVADNRGSSNNMYIYRYDLQSDKRTEIFCSRRDAAVASDHIHIAFDDSEKGLCTYNLDTKQYKQILVNGEMIHNWRLMLNGKGVYFVHRSKSTDYKDILYGYYFSNEKVVELDQIDEWGFSERQSIMYDNMIYYANRLTLKRKKFGMKPEIVIDGNTKEIEESCKDLILSCGINLRAYRNLIILSSAQKRFPLYCISDICGEKPIIQKLGENCGERRVDSHLIRNSDLFRSAGAFCLLGQTIYYFTNGEEVNRVRLHTPEKVDIMPEKDENGRSTRGLPSMYTYKFNYNAISTGP